jgi:ABC-type sugar transport system substrate-binding protein
MRNIAKASLLALSLVAFSSINASAAMHENNARTGVTLQQQDSTFLRVTKKAAKKSAKRTVAKKAAKKKSTACTKSLKNRAAGCFTRVTALSPFF